jgi:hypothetical protein
MRHTRLRLYHRMKRRLLNLLTLLSALLCVAAVTLWVRSFSVQDVFRWNTTHAVGSDVRRTNYEIFSVRGHNVLHVQAKTYTQEEFDRVVRPVDASLTPQQRSHWYTMGTHAFRFNYNPDVRGREFWVRLGFRYSGSTWDGDPPFPGFMEARLPHWLVALLTAVLPIMWCYDRWRSSRRHAAGHCPRCGYDLRATPGRCPECGTPAAGSPAGS